MSRADDLTLNGPTATSLGIGPRELQIYRVSFLLAALYNLVWGTTVILFPTLAFRLARLDTPDPVGLLFWQCIGMFVLVYAIGYAYLWHNPLRYAPFALVATLGKIFGPLGWVWAYTQGLIPLHTGLTILTNDIIWWPVWFPFVYKTLIRPAFAPQQPANV